MLDSRDIEDAQLGNSKVAAMFLGSKLVWPKPPISIATRNGTTHIVYGNNTIVSSATFYPANVPAPSSTIRKTKFVDIGQQHSVALLIDGTVVQWGNNNYGQLNGFPSGVSGVTTVRASLYNTAAVKNEGSVVVWGSNNESGQKNVPASATNVIDLDIACESGYHYVAVKSDGTVVCWGFNFFGQCNPPAGLNRVVKVRTTQKGSVAMLDDDTFVVWGSGTGGRVNGTGNPSPNTSGILDFVLPGEYSTLILRIDGSLESWGSSGYGSTIATNVAAVARSGGMYITRDNQIGYP